MQKGLLNKADLEIDFAGFKGDLMGRYVTIARNSSDKLKVSICE